jgi:acetyl esterase/lipase
MTLTNVTIQWLATIATAWALGSAATAQAASARLDEVQRRPDIAYGSEARQRFDVYLPAQPPRGAPVIAMVHGGAWMIGNRRCRRWSRTRSRTGSRKARSSSRSTTG